MRFQEIELLNHQVKVLDLRINRYFDETLFTCANDRKICESVSIFHIKIFFMKYISCAGNLCNSLMSKYG